METGGSVTGLIERWKAGEEQALDQILKRFRNLLLSRAGQRLGGAARRACDEEDVAQEVCLDLHKGAEAERWKDIANRHDLVKLLAHIAERKAANLLRRERAQKRGGGRVLDEAAAAGSPDASGEAGLERLAIDADEQPAEDVLGAEWLERCLDCLAPTLRPVAEMNLFGRTVPEIASELGCSERTIARKLAIIRARWVELLQALDHPAAATGSTTGGGSPFA